MEAAWDETIIGQTADYVALDAARVTKVPVPVRRHLVRRAFEYLLPGGDVTHAMLERGAKFLGGQGRRRQDLAGGLVLVREPGVIYLSRGEGVLPFDAWPQMPAGREFNSGPCAGSG